MYSVYLHCTVGELLKRMYKFIDCYYLYDNNHLKESHVYSFHEVKKTKS